jgi:hypothetical protein
MRLKQQSVQVSVAENHKEQYCASGELLVSETWLCARQRRRRQFTDKQSMNGDLLPPRAKDMRNLGTSKLMVCDIHNDHSSLVNCPIYSLFASSSMVRG